MTDIADWTHIQSFLAVAKGGSLSEAARASGNSQPTMGRHIAALETDLGVQLFERTGAGLALTATGVELLAYADDMGVAADRLSLMAQGRSEAIAGTVRITASEIVAAFVLPPILTTLHLAEPDIEVELVVTNRTDNLLRREADIALRMYRPTQAELIARKVGDLQLGIFAAPSYLDRRGTPKTLADIGHHDVIGYDRDTQIIDGLREAGLDIDPHFFSMRCDNQIVCWQMVLAGFGIGLNQQQIGKAEPRVRQLDVGVEMPTLPLWLTTHSELHSSRRVRRVFDFLADQLQKS